MLQVLMQVMVFKTFLEELISLDLKMPEDANQKL
jgi:hypothetical protein